MTNEDKIKQNDKLDSLDTEIKALRKKRKILANNTTKEDVNGRKFFNGMLNVLNPVQWLKTITMFFNLRILLIVAIICGVMWFKGYQHKPVMVNCKDFVVETVVTAGLNRGDTLRIKSSRGHMYYQFIHKDGTKSKEWVVRQKDIPMLKPYGIELKPKFFAGFGTDGPAAGVGVELAHFWKLNLDAFFMSDLALYLGISYDLESSNRFLSNSAVGLAIGKSIKNVDKTNIMLYWSIKF